MEWIKRIELDYGVLDVPLFTLAGTPVTLATLVVFAAIVAATWLVSFLVGKAVTRGFRLRGVKDEGTIEVFRRLIHYAILATGLAVGLQTVGINLAALFAAGAFLAIGLGFAMQNIMQNFVSGVILLTERSITPGDVLQIEGRFVRVQKLGIRATIAKTLDEEEIIVPNSVIVQSTVTNYTLKDSLYRLRCTVGVIYGSDMILVRDTLARAAQEVPWRIKALKDAGITIAFPQLDVHFDPPVMESLGRLGRSDAA
jgi:small-conductance mechanosensitive channel